MISKLKDKGFKWNSRNECLEGEFNGQNVFLHIITNKNKVYRILVEETYSYNPLADLNNKRIVDK